MKYRKWTLVPRDKGGGATEEDGDDDYNPKEKVTYVKEMLPCESSRADFMTLYVDGMKVRAIRDRT